MYLWAMRLSSLEEYGIRCLLRVARHTGDGPVDIPDIARAEGLSQAYTAKLMRVLRQGNLVTSIRGVAGGYRLARPADQITVWQVIETLDGPIWPGDFCAGHSGCEERCLSSDGCSLRVVWHWVDGAVKSGLDRVTLADLVKGDSQVKGILESVSATPPRRTRTGSRKSAAKAVAK